MSLQIIQSKLKVPKSQYNKFGEYYYRSCEDILEAVKPVLAELKYSLIVTDEMVEVGGRVYVKATALISTEDNKVLGEAVGHAREVEDKKKMDLAQITGAASSYARKYALNGLLAIDDAKDADSQNQNNGNDKETTKENEGKTITPRQHFFNAQLNDQIEEIQKLVRETGYERENDIPLDRFKAKERLAMYDKLIKLKKEMKTNG